MTHDIKNWTSHLDTLGFREYHYGDTSFNAYVKIIDRQKKHSWWMWDIKKDGMYLRDGTCKNECDAMQVCEVLMALPFKEAC